MMLRVVATSLKTGQAKWWDEKSDRIIEGCEASGAIAPIIYPMEVDSEGFVDGGFVANTPIMKALEDGAQTVVVVNLDPVNTTGLIPDLEALSKAGIDVGLSIVEFEFNMMQQRYFLEHELQMACFGFPDRRILAFTPRTDPGNFLSFSGKALQRMREQGIETVRASAPVDLCKSFFPAGPSGADERRPSAASGGCRDLPRDKCDPDGLEVCSPLLHAGTHEWLGTQARGLWAISARDRCRFGRLRVKASSPRLKRLKLQSRRWES
ncbi:unnamed protein product [Durusdinium trenchii]|uniref:PNPLA domain-containing protein n=1 Tax=Durusdinium trenchii TaxID=1381693 RepID=A0ABP0PX49_9DINO